MIEAIIVDDEPNNILLLKSLIEQYSPEKINCHTANNINDFQNIIRTHNIEIIFMDIHLGNNTTGFDYLNSINHEGKFIIFVTAHAKYALTSFKYNVVDYLIKPIEIEQLQHAISKALTKIQSEKKPIINANQKNLFLAVSSVNKIDLIEIKTILFIKAHGKYSEIVTENNKYISSKNLHEFETTLINNLEFIRLHHSYVVNLNQVKLINKETSWFCTMVNSYEVPISRRRQDEVYKKLKIKL
jgi:two-component system LytT family response regulator